MLSDSILRANGLIDNLKLALDACTLAVFCGYEPVAPHLYYPQFLHDEDENERTFDMKLSNKKLERCQEVWFISSRISSGMSAEIGKTQEFGIPVKVFTAEGFQEYRGDGEVTDNCSMKE